MRTESTPFTLATPGQNFLTLCIAQAFTDCGGGGGLNNTSNDGTADDPPRTVTLWLNLRQLSQGVATQQARLLSQIAAATLSEPSVPPSGCGDLRIAPTASAGDYATYTLVQMRRA